VDPLEGVDAAESAAIVAAATQAEPQILAWAKNAIESGENVVAAALEGGFRANVPLAGGSIAKAIGAAVATLEGEQATSLKAVYDATLAKLRAAAKPAP
jgi:hypothetical protein